MSKRKKFTPDEPKYQKWFKADVFNRDELGLLAVGVEPNSSLGKDMCNAYEGEGYDSFIKKYGRQKTAMSLMNKYAELDNLISRSLDGGNLNYYQTFRGGNIPIEKAVPFVLQTELACPAFVQAARAWAESKQPTAPTKSKHLKEKPLHSKEKETLLKMIIGMAMDGYGFDPSANRSPVPKEISDILTAKGTSLDADTVRRWLKEAAEILPRNIDKD